MIPADHRFMLLSAADVRHGDKCYDWVEANGTLPKLLGGFASATDLIRRCTWPPVSTQGEPLREELLLVRPLPRPQGHRALLPLEGLPAIATRYDRGAINFLALSASRNRQLLVVSPDLSCRCT